MDYAFGNNNYDCIDILGIKYLAINEKKIVSSIIEYMEFNNIIRQKKLFVST